MRIWSKKSCQTPKKITLETLTVKTKYLSQKLQTCQEQDIQIGVNFHPNYTPGYAPPQYTCAFGSGGLTIANDTSMIYEQYMNLMAQYRDMAIDMACFGDMVKNQQQQQAISEHHPP